MAVEDVRQLLPLPPVDAVMLQPKEVDARQPLPAPDALVEAEDRP